MPFSGQVFPVFYTCAHFPHLSLTLLVCPLSSLVFAWFLYVVPSLYPPSILCSSYMLPVLYAWPPLSMCAPIHTCPRGSMHASILFCDSVLYVCLLPSTHAPICYSCPCLPHMPQPSTSSDPTEGVKPSPHSPWSRFRGDSWQWLWQECHIETHDISKSLYLCLSPRRQNLCKESTGTHKAGEPSPTCPARPSHTLAGHQRVSGNLPWWWLKTQIKVKCQQLPKTQPPYNSQ